MKKIIKNTAIALSVFALASCTVSGPLHVTDNAGGKNSKTGEASFKVILGFRPMNADASIVTAARNGDITKVATVDQKIRGGFFTMTYTTVVTGE